MHLNCRELLWDCRQKWLILREVGQNLSVKVWPDCQQQGRNPDPGKPGHLLDLLTTLLSRERVWGSSPTCYGAFWPCSRWADARPAALPLVSPRHFLGKANAEFGCAWQVAEASAASPLPACLPSTTWCSRSVAFQYCLAAKGQGQDFLV